MQRKADWFSTKAGKAWVAQRSRQPKMSDDFEDTYKRIAMLMCTHDISLAECRKVQRKHITWSRKLMPAGRHATYSVLVELLSFEDGEASSLRVRSDNAPLEFRHIKERTGKQERQVRRDLAWLKKSGWIASHTTEIGHHSNSRSRYSFPRLADALQAHAEKPAKTAPLGKSEVSSKTPHKAESEVSSKTPIIRTGSVEDRKDRAAFRKASGPQPGVRQETDVGDGQEASHASRASAPCGRKEGSPGGRPLPFTAEPLSSPKASSWSGMGAGRRPVGPAACRGVLEGLGRAFQGPDRRTIVRQRLAGWGRSEAEADAFLANLGPRDDFEPSLDAYIRHRAAAWAMEAA